MQLYDRLRARFRSLRLRGLGRPGSTALLRRLSVSTRVGRVFARMFSRELPPLAITQIQRPALLVLMAGTTVQQYEQAGQLGRLTASLERHARYFRTVLLMTADRSSYTEQIALEGVRHLRTPVPWPFSGASLASLGVLLRFRSVRQTTAVVLIDEQAASAGWLASRLGGSAMSMSVGAPWAPPRNSSVDGWRQWLMRKALNRVESIVEWPGTKERLELPNTETVILPPLVDVDLYCPLTTTDPARPRTIGVFIGPENETGARIIIGVAERLKRRRQNAVVRVFVTGAGGRTARAAALQGEAQERDVAIEFEPLPEYEMLPDAISRMRLCVAFGTGDSVQYLLRAMASGVPGIAIEADQAQSGSGSEASEGPDWTNFVLNSSATEEEITRNIETLFREPGVRLRLAREGRRFVVASHSLDALAARETRLLLGPDANSFAVEPAEAPYDPEAEAEKLAAMLEMVGVVRIETNSDMDVEEMAA